MAEQVKSKLKQAKQLEKQRWIKTGLIATGAVACAGVLVAISCWMTRDATIHELKVSNQYAEPPATVTQITGRQKLLDAVDTMKDDQIRLLNDQLTSMKNGVPTDRPTELTASAAYIQLSTQMDGLLKPTLDLVVSMPANMTSEAKNAIKSQLKETMKGPDDAIDALLSSKSPLIDLDAKQLTITGDITSSVIATGRDDSVVVVADVPIVTSEGKVAIARYVAGIDRASEIKSLSYVGVLDKTPLNQAKAISTALDAIAHK